MRDFPLTHVHAMFSDLEKGLRPKDTNEVVSIKLLGAPGVEC